MTNKYFSKIKNLFDNSDPKFVPEKTFVRQQIARQKEYLSDIQKANKAKVVFESIEQEKAFIDAKTILLYWSMPDELPTHDFIRKWSSEKQILLPVVKGHEMLIKPYKDEENLVANKWGIWEPDVQGQFMRAIDLVIVPGIAFDKRKNRLGRGKGYYDKYFTNKRIVKWGVCFDCQLLEKIPAAPFDIKMDKVFTSLSIVE